MTEERFLTLAGTYGGDLRRWPADERLGAEAFARSHPAVANACLTAERLLDEALDRYVAAAPDAALRDRVISTAKRAVAGGRRAWRWLTGAGLGLGLASSAAAGAIAGYTLGHPALLRLTLPSALDAGEVSPLADPADEAASG